MMGAAGVSSSIASQRFLPRPYQIPGWCSCKNRAQNHVPYLLYSPYSQMKLGSLSRLSSSVKDKMPTIRTERFGFGLRLLNSERGKLGLVSARTAVVRAQKEDKDDQKLVKEEQKSSESWVSSIHRASTVSRVFMAACVWISLFFGMSITNSETGGGRTDRRGPRK